MTIAKEELRLLATLLDEAWDLPLEQHERWLASMRPEVAHLAPRLREMLRQSSSGTAADVELPTWSGLVGEEPPTHATGALVGPYRLLEPLGSGGMGEVWLAERADGIVHRKVALKLPHVGWSSQLAERFERERKILATLEHPHIARLYDAGADALGRPYMALEYVEGLPIDRYCLDRRVDVAGKLQLLLQVAAAVAFAHGRLVLHRDLKPGNILVTADGQIRLLDFGIAKLMQDGRAVETALTQAAGRALTLDYASPEQIRGDSIGTASDVYSFGVVAFELLAGERPYRLRRGTAAELEDAIAHQDVPLASSVASASDRRQALRGDVDAILNKALKKAQEERYGSIDALAQDIRRHLEGSHVSARPDSLGYRALRLMRRHRLPLAAGAVVVATFCLSLGFGATAVVVAALLIGLGGALWQAQRARTDRDRALVAQQRAEQTRQFLSDMLSETEPIPGRENQPPTALEMLDRAVNRVERDHAAHPLLQADILIDLGRVYQRLSQIERSVRPLRLAIDLLERTAPAHDPALHEARAYGANDRLVRGDEAGARALWQGVLAGCTTADTRGWKVIGYAHYSLGCDPDLAPPTVRAHLQSCVAAYDRGYGRLHEALYQPLERLAQSAIEFGDLAAAEAVFARMDDVARLTPQKTIELERVEGVRAEFDLAQGRPADAWRRLESLVRRPHVGRPAYLTAGFLLQQADLSIALGLPERALGEARRAFLDAPGTAPSRRHLRSRLAEAAALSLLGRQDAASAALVDARSQTAALGIDPATSIGFTAQVLAARVAARRGDVAAAAATVMPLVEAIAQTRGPTHTDALVVALLAAVLDFADGRIAQSNARARGVVRARTAHRRGVHPVVHKAALLEGLAAAQGSAPTTLALGQAVARIDGWLDPQAEIRVRLREVLARPAPASVVQLLLDLA